MKINIFTFLKISPFITWEALTSITPPSDSDESNRCLFLNYKNHALSVMGEDNTLIHAIDSLDDLKTLLSVDYLSLEEKMDLFEILLDSSTLGKSTSMGVAIKSAKKALAAKLATNILIPTDHRISTGIGLAVGIFSAATTLLNPDEPQLIRRPGHLENMLTGFNELETYAFISILRTKPFYDDLAMRIIERESHQLPELSVAAMDYLNNSTILPSREAILAACPVSSVVKIQANKLISWIYQTEELANQLGFGCSLNLLENNLIDFFNTIIDDLSSVPLERISNSLNWAEVHSDSDTELDAEAPACVDPSLCSGRGGALVKISPEQSETLKLRAHTCVMAFSKALEKANLAMIKTTPPGAPVDIFHDEIASAHVAIWEAVKNLSTLLNTIAPKDKVVMFSIINQYIPNLSRPTFLCAIPTGYNKKPIIEHAQDVPDTLTNTLIQFLIEEIQKIQQRGTGVRRIGVNEEKKALLINILSKIANFLSQPDHDVYAQHCYYITKIACELELNDVSATLAGGLEMAVHRFFPSAQFVKSKSTQSLEDAMKDTTHRIEIQSQPDEASSASQIADDLFNPDVEISVLLEKHKPFIEGIMKIRADSPGEKLTIKN